MSAATLAHLCARVRPELACLGEAGTPLLTVLATVERAGPDRPLDALADPGFALDVLTSAGPGTDVALVGRVLDFLRARNGVDAGGNGHALVVPQPEVTVTEAVATFGGGSACHDGSGHGAHLSHVDTPAGGRPP